MLLQEIGFIWFECAGCNVSLIPHGRSESKKKKKFESQWNEITRGRREPKGLKFFPQTLPIGMELSP